MKKTNKSIVLIFIFVLVFVFSINSISIGIDCIDSCEEESNSRINLVSAAYILQILVTAIILLTSIVRFFILRFKNNKKILDEKERDEKNKALKKGLTIWGAINLLEGYGNDNPGAKSQGMKQLMAGGGEEACRAGGRTQAEEGSRGSGKSRPQGRRERG